jgi:hypothetical protein
MPSKTRDIAIVLLFIRFSRQFNYLESIEALFKQRVNFLSRNYVDLILPTLHFEPVPCAETCLAEIDCLDKKGRNAVPIGCITP